MVRPPVTSSGSSSCPDASCCPPSTRTVIGFVLSTVIRSLGEVSNPSDIPPWSVARPLVTSFLYIALAVPFARYILAPSYRRFLHSRLIRSRFRTRIAFVLLIGALSLGVAVTMLIGSSPLLGVYVVGLVLPYLSPTPSLDDRADGRVLEIQPFQEAFDLYLQPVQSYILSPLFFASIGCVAVLTLVDPAQPAAAKVLSHSMQMRHPVLVPLVEHRRLERDRLRRAHARGQGGLRHLASRLGPLQQADTLVHVDTVPGLRRAFAVGRTSSSIVRVRLDPGDVFNRRSSASPSLLSRPVLPRPPSARPTANDPLSTGLGDGRLPRSRHGRSWRSRPPDRPDWLHRVGPAERGGLPCRPLGYPAQHCRWTRRCRCPCQAGRCQSEGWVLEVEASAQFSSIAVRQGT